ncbi:hypothetical protein F5888DRAFT_111124 [Russula emetica]|nr:hypothetical protein F5888DRAFT_111124 [Russula emetica]
MPHLLTESTLTVHNCVNDCEDYKARQILSSELHRVKTWITSIARPSVTRTRATSLATINSNAESQVSEGSVCRCGSLEKEDEKCGYPSQDREILGKRAREMAGSRVEKSTSVAPPTKKPRLESSKRQTKYTNSDPPSQATEGLVWRDRDSEDEDDTCEYRAIVLGERHNFSLAIKDGGTTTIIPPRTYEPRVERPKHRIKDTNIGLPHGVYDDWYKKFIPTYKKWLGTRVKPWIIDEDESIAALQVIWRAIYPHIDYVIDAKCLVYRMANTRVHSWQGSFDSAAIEMFKSNYEDLGFYSKETISNASRLLQNNRFMYAKTTGETQKKSHGLFRSPFILKLIAGHYDSISGAIRIPEFERAFSRDQQKLVKNLETILRTLDADSWEALEIAVKLDTMRMYPKGALALCVTAVEHALGIFAPAGGALFARHSDKYIEKVQKYSDIIERKLRPGSMEDIVLKACPFMGASTSFITYLSASAP